MSIATASELEVATLRAAALKVANILQEYVQGSANGAKGTLSRLTVAEVNVLIEDLKDAAEDVVPT